MKWAERHSWIYTAILISSSICALWSLNAKNNFNLISQYFPNVTWFYSTGHELSKRTFLDLIFDSDQFQYLYMVEPGNDNEWTLDFFTFPPEDQGWIHVSTSNYAREEIYHHIVLTGENKCLCSFIKLILEKRKTKFDLLFSTCCQCKIPSIDIHLNSQQYKVEMFLFGLFHLP